MGDLREEMRKAGLLSAKAAKKLERAERQRQHDLLKAERVGDEGAVAALETEQDKRRRELEAQQEATRAAEAARVEAARHAREEAQHWQRIHALIDSNKVKPGRGDRVWNFVAADGGLEQMRVSEQVEEQLLAGELAIVERPGNDAPEDAYRYELLPVQDALRLEQLDPFALRFLSRLDHRDGPQIRAREDTCAPSTPPEEDDFTAGL